MNLLKAAIGAWNATAETPEAQAIRQTVIDLWQQTDCAVTADSDAEDALRNGDTKVKWQRGDRYAKTYRIEVMIKPAPRWKRTLRRIGLLK